MVYSGIIAALHFIFMALTFTCLVTELVLFRPSMEPKQAKTLFRVDLFYLITAMGLLATGLLRWGVFEKGPAYYNQNLLFQIKMGLFITIGILSVPPTMQYYRLTRMQKPHLSETTFRRTRGWVYLELGFLLALPFLSSLIARGFGSK